MEPTRILHTESSIGLGGQEYRIVSEAAGMSARGHAVTLAVPPESKIQELAGCRGLPVELISLRTHRWIPLIVDFLRLIRKHSIQIINTHGSLDSWTSSIAGRMSGLKPIIIRTRHKSSPISGGLRHRILYRQLPHAIITTGTAVREHIIRQQAIDPGRVVSIPTGVDLEVYRPLQPDPRTREHLGLSPRHVVIGTVAFMRDYKGLSYLVDAASLVCRQCPDARFVIVGDGPERARLAEQISTLGLSERIVMTGFREDIPQLLGMMDIFVLSSVGGEGLPQGLTQAMAMERPVVATNVGSVAEVVKHRATGLLVAPRDMASLAESLLLLIREQDVRARMARAARNLIAGSYSLQTMLDLTEDLYSRLLEMRRHPGRSSFCSEKGARGALAG